MNSPMRPVVSIAMPAYRPGPVFGDTLRSCLRQEFKDIEVVISLDGDDDGVAAAVEKANDPRVRLIINGCRLGQFGNFNRAVDECRGEFVKLLCADDLLARDAVSRMVEAMQAHPEVGLCSAQMFAFWSREDGSLEPRLSVPEPTGTPIRVFTPAEGRWFTAWNGNLVGGPSNVMIRRRDWWRAGGFDPRMDHCGEQGLWYRLIARSGLLLVDRPLVGYRNHANSVTGRGALTFDRVEQPFMMAETATLGAAFPNEAWRERLVRMLQTVNSTAGYAASMVRREPLRGWRAVWRVVTAAGLVMVPIAAALALWAVLRSSVARSGSFWPFSGGPPNRMVGAPGLDVSGLLGMLDDPSAQGSLLRGARS